jgi:hypothetical protein
MAVRRRWNIDTEKAAAQVNELINDPDPRISVRALGIAALMEGQNQKDEHKLLDVSVETRHDRLDAIAADLGIEASFIKAIEAGSDSGVDSNASSQAD